MWRSGPVTRRVSVREEAVEEAAGAVDFPKRACSRAGEETPSASAAVKVVSKIVVSKIVVARPGRTTRQLIAMLNSANLLRCMITIVPAMGWPANMKNWTEGGMAEGQRGRGAEGRGAEGREEGPLDP